MPRFSDGKPCIVCGRPHPPGTWFSHGRCQTCAQYRRRKGQDRPMGAANGKPCIVCGLPRKDAGQFSGARCRGCYLYRWRHGVDRPRGTCPTCGRGGLTLAARRLAKEA